MKILITTFLIAFVFAANGVCQRISDCPDIGHGGDTSLNRKKNRFDTPALKAVNVMTFDSFRAPHITGEWAVDGQAVQLIGYVDTVRREGKEDCNCNFTGNDNIDFHITLVEQPSDTEMQSVTAEMTPRVRLYLKHPEWKIKKPMKIKKENLVRVTG